MKRYDEFVESVSFGYDKIFYLKVSAESKNGKNILIGFKTKNIEDSIWVPKKSVYNILDNSLPKLNDDYKKMVIGSFIYKPSEYDFGYEDKIRFFKNYDDHMVPLIDKLKDLKKDNYKEDLLDEFNLKIKNIIPDLEVVKYDYDKDIIVTNIGNFRLFKRNPLIIKINDVSLTLSSPVKLHYLNMFVEALGKNGIIVKALIKHNTNQKLNAVEKLSIKRLYSDFLSKYDWTYDRSDDRRAYKQGQQQSKKLQMIQNILKEIGEENYSKALYNRYREKNI